MQFDRVVPPTPQLSWERARYGDGTVPCVEGRGWRFGSRLNAVLTKHRMTKSPGVDTVHNMLLLQIVG